MQGRERHPYPVGYEATRTYNGINSTIQILQGDTGPLFQVIIQFEQITAT